MRWRGSVRRERGWQGAFLVQRACELSEPALTNHAVRGSLTWRHVIRPRVRAGPSRVVLRNPVCSFHLRPEEKSTAETTASACGRCRGEHETSRSPTACGTPDANGVTVATTLVCFSLLHTGLRMRSRIRRSARPHFEGGTNESFGRPRAVITTGAMTRVVCAGCLKIESGATDGARLTA